MTDYDTTNQGQGHLGDAPSAEITESERLDLLMGRLADGQGSQADWAAFVVLAGQRAEVWRALAVAQRQQAALAIAVGAALGACERVELPLEAGRVHGAADRTDALTPGRRRRVGGVLPRWAGWATAAAVCLMWFTSAGKTLFNPRAVAPGGAGRAMNVAGISPANWTINTPEDAVQAYLDVGGRAGSVMGELPQRMLVQSRPADGGGGVEVVFIRQFVERAVVTDLVRFGQDEAGRPVPMTVPLTIGSGGAASLRRKID